MASAWSAEVCWKLKRLASTFFVAARSAARTESAPRPRLSGCTQANSRRLPNEFGVSVPPNVGSIGLSRNSVARPSNVALNWNTLPLRNGFVYWPKIDVVLA